MTSEQKQLTALVAGTFFLLCVICSWFFGYHKGFKTAQQPIKEVHDTLVQRCTLTVVRPVETVKYKDKLVFIPVHDTTLIHTHDTTYIALQSEKKIYEDTDYRAVVSGIYPKLEEISVFPKTVTITDTRTIRKRWGFGITAGPSVLWNGKVQAGIGVTAGISWTF